LQLVVAETDGVTVAEQPSGRGLGIVELYAKEIGGLVVQVLYQGLVFCANLYPQFVFLVDEGVAEVVVQMSMSCQQVDGLQMLPADIVYKGSAFFLIEHTAVDDDTLAARVAYHVAVFLQRVANNALYIHRGR
jgi:hypothetical protein